MTPERARELLGGLSTGILTPEERQILFEAALHDQTLFNEVADELEFAAFLQSPDTRAQLANRIEPEPEPRRRSWALRPAWMALMGTAAAATVLYVAVAHRPGRLEPKQTTSTEIAPPLPVPSQEAPQERPIPVPPSKPAPPQAKQAPQPKSQSQAVLNSLPPEAARAGTDARRAAKDEVEVQARNQPAATDKKEAASELQEAARQKQFAPLAGAAPQKARNSFRAPETPSPAPVMPAAAPAPPNTASLEGTLRDPSGSAVPNAQVDIVDTATGASVHARSDAAGHFGAASLPPGGPYEVTAQAPGFRQRRQSGLMLTAGQPVHADLEMQLGDVAESVNVTAAASAISTGQQPLRAVGGVLGPTQQVAVLDFANRTSQSQSGQQAADLLSNQLVDSGQVRVIDRDKVQQARQSQDQQSGQTAQQAGERQLSNRDAVALGRALGADAVIVGTVQPAKSNVAVSAQVIDTHRARELAKVVKSDASLKGATDQVGLALQTQLMPPLEGSIIRLDAGSLGITFQPPARPRIGLRLSVYRERRKIGEVTLTSISGQSAIGKFSGSGDPRVGDRVTSVR